MDALVWNFTVLGEASREISTELKEARPRLPWGDPVRLRKRIVHGYWSVEADVLLSTARDDVPVLRSELRSSLAEPAADRPLGDPLMPAP
ncbi:MAG: HepT-like ribonuclease domain-containing protein [Aquihabitans sp.]